MCHNKQTLDQIKQIVADSKHITVVSGLEISKAAGLNGVRSEDIAYDVEQKYGYSNDEIVSALFLSRRVDIFFDYYRNIILNKFPMTPTKVHEGIALLEKAGKLDAVVTRSTYNLHQDAGCRKVIALHGSVEENKCPNCGKIFDSAFIKKSTSVPVCDECQVTIRPGFVLMGEMVDNGKMSKACDAVENAEVVIVVGASANSTLCRHLLKYYTGKKLILLNVKETHGDEKIPYRVYGDLCEMFSYIVEGIEPVIEEEETEDIKEIQE